MIETGSHTNGLVKLLFVAFACTFLGHYVGGKLVSPAVFICALVAVHHAVLGATAEGSREAARLRRPFFLFVGIGALALVLSPYSGAAMQKGAFQVVGLVIVLLTASAIEDLIRGKPAEFSALLRLATTTLAVIAVVGVAQSLCSNVLGAPGVSDFSFLNEIAGGKVWGDPGMLGGLYRSASVMTEPAHFCLFLGMGAGVAILRLGLFGRGYKDATRSVMPRWGAIAIFLGFLVSLSILGYLQLLLTVAMVWAFSRRVRVTRALTLAFRIAVVGIALLVMAHLAGSEFEEKLDTINLITDADAGAETQTTISVSALALATNVQVFLSQYPENPILGIGFGAHPVAYAEHVPDWALDSELLWGLNAQGGGSLLLRLLSETGLLGTAVFLFACAGVLLRARRAILRCIESTLESGASPPPDLALAIGVAASTAGVLTMFLLRYPVYYEPLLWMLLAMTASIPAVLKATQQDRNHASQSSSSARVAQA